MGHLVRFWYLLHCRATIAHVGSAYQSLRCSHEDLDNNTDHEPHGICTHGVLKVFCAYAISIKIAFTGQNVCLFLIEFTPIEFSPSDYL